MSFARALPARSTTHLLVLILVLVSASACARSAPEPPTPAAAPLAGEYTGSLSVEGNLLPASLTIAQDGVDLRLDLSIPTLGASAQGTGVAHADRFSASVPYEINCPGEASFEGRLEEDGRLLTGSLTARDCDGTMTGTFRFSRQDL
ncbi:MAG: hypothetical protein EA350_05585 [Gemmatimonadales bacterium]|nr:MAG: hypothetical protein EA350_05585 [Gemmatimonadales bacterium]